MVLGYNIKILEVIMRADTVHQRFIEKGWTLSLAESCTGGSLAASLTQISGASNYFLGSVVAYSNALKIKILKVPEDLLREHGAVSREVVASMLDGILSLTGSDYAMAVSGIAGPGGGTPAKPVGTVWGGIGKRDGQRHVWSWREPGNRAQVIAGSVDRLLEELIKLTEPQSDF